jgi:hypothetical protein
MRHPFASEPNSLSSSARFSVSIRPLTVKITSPFADLVIFSIFPSIDISFLSSGWVGRTIADGNHSSNRKVIKIDGLAAGEMSGHSPIAEIPYSRLGSQFFCGWVRMGLADFRGGCSFEAIFVDLQ